MVRKKREQDGLPLVDLPVVIAVAAMIQTLKCKIKLVDQSRALKIRLIMTMISKLSNQKKLFNRRRNSQLW